MESRLFLEAPLYDPDTRGIPHAGRDFLGIAGNEEEKPDYRAATGERLNPCYPLNYPEALITSLPVGFNLVFVRLHDATRFVQTMRFTCKDGRDVERLYDTDGRF